jgi:hypothetical protein
LLFLTKILDVAVLNLFPARPNLKKVGASDWSRTGDLGLMSRRVGSLEASVSQNASKNCFIGLPATIQSLCRFY